MKKIYITRYSKLSITLEMGGVSANIEFKNGRMNDNVPARFITSDPFLQYLVEHDNRFGNLFRLEKSIPEPGDEKKAEEKREAKKTGFLKGQKPQEDVPTEEPVPTGEPEGQAETGATVASEVRDLSDAIDYLSGLGKVCTTARQVKIAMKQLNVEFPNWKEE